MAAKDSRFDKTERPTAVVSALRRELAPLWRKSQVESRITTVSGRGIRTRLGQHPLVLGWTGDGRQAAEGGLRSLLAWQTVDRIVVLGVAGGLSPELDAGQLVVATEIRDARGAAPPPDDLWTQQALAAPEVASGLLYTSDQILTQVQDKTNCWQRLGQPPVATVDLETAVWARVAAEHQIPFVAIRAVSDPADDDLPLDFERYRGADGQVRSSRVAAAALLRPRLIQPLRRLQKRVDICAARLATWTLDFLNGQPSPLD